MKPYPLKISAIIPLLETIPTGARLTGVDRVPIPQHLHIRPTVSDEKPRVRIQATTLTEILQELEPILIELLILLELLIAAVAVGIMLPVPVCVPMAMPPIPPALEVMLDIMPDCISMVSGFLDRS